jgi:hypothetical protein
MADKPKPTIDFSMNHPKVDVPNYGSVPVSRTPSGDYQPVQQQLSYADAERIAAAIREWRRRNEV